MMINHTTKTITVKRGQIITKVTQVLKQEINKRISTKDKQLFSITQTTPHIRIKPYIYNNNARNWYRSTNQQNYRHFNSHENYQNLTNEIHRQNNTQEQFLQNRHRRQILLNHSIDHKTHNADLKQCITKKINRNPKK
jgi:hypothetical protein